MLKTEMIDKLNAQMNLELFSSLLYQQMSACAATTASKVRCAFLRRHAQKDDPHAASV